MQWTSQFIIAVSSSLTTAILLWMLRQFVKLRKLANGLLREHRYLMASMQIVLAHLGLDKIAQEANGKR